MSRSKPWLNTIFVDDATTAGEHNFFSYTGKAWWFSTDTPKERMGTWYVLDTVSGLSSVDNSESVTLSFHGTGAIFYGSIVSAGKTCTFSYSLDDAPLQDITIPSGERGVFNVTSLSNGDHTVRLTNTAELSLRVDYALITTDADTPIEENAIASLAATSPDITYKGFKLYPGSQGDLDEMHTSTNGDSLQFEFIGNSLRFVGSWWDQLYTTPSGDIVISTSLDGATPSVQTVAVRTGFTVDEAWLQIQMDDLPPPPSGDKHTFNLTVLTVHPTAQVFMVDSFLYSNSSSFVTRTAEASSSSALPRPTSSGQPGSNNNYQDFAGRPLSMATIIFTAVFVGGLVIGTMIAGFIWWKNRTSKRLKNLNLTQGPPPPGAYMMYQSAPSGYPQTPYTDTHPVAGPSSGPAFQNPYAYQPAPSSDRIERT